MSVIEEKVAKTMRRRMKLNKLNKTINNVVVCSDFDDTINNLLPTWVNYLNNTYKLNVDYRNICEWDIPKFFPELTPEQIFRPLYEKSFWEKVTLKEDAAYYISKLINEGVDFYISTSTSHTTIFNKVESCLLPNLPMIDKKKIITIHNKSLLKCDFIIDDGIFNLKSSDAIKILMDAPHNQIGTGIEDYRVYSWKEIYDIIHSYVDDLSVRKQFTISKIDSFKYRFNLYEDGVLKSSEEVWEGDEFADYVSKLNESEYELAHTRAELESVINNYTNMMSKLLIGE